MKDIGDSATTDTRRVALIHYWLVGMRGGEKVLESLCRMFPNADIYTHVVDPSNLSATLTKHKIVESRIGRLPFAKRMYQKYLPLMPRALEELDLSEYDLVISSEAGPAKGIIAPPNAPHLCYCHSPMRYLWDQYHVYRGGAGHLTKLMMPQLTHRLRQWDVTSAARVDGFVANSNFVAKRIEKYWRRGADVVHPPVAIDQFTPAEADDIGDYYLWVGELAPYKRPDLAIEAFAKLGRKLEIIGGPSSEVERLRPLAGPNTRFLGKASWDVLCEKMARCKALIFPGEEDFGIVPVEAMAAGRPVLAYGSGGILDTVIDAKTGLFFEEQTVDALIDCVERFEASGLGENGAQDCVAQARKFSESHFQDGIRRSLEKITA
ncbi:D-inositol 3-phosphate glycosyltransferase [Tritonibacter multivorans]|uniref:D-inositol 3-phosphate glycosyltransferase n=1 Tax=Tritonibacter multivorans TaxID=928856 RepID=A0A0P1GBN8_9RHOB|nr:glycosyltransferase [Tritonibacter multivorans]MDA7421981.1 glycosyltransferase [Tritonibacter multivorans]CUH78735.1 D-inositol 3-phosphate glycosyltransferase [Tritonibacter multivorans]SFD68203.1 Glycosyltransferase involved in cell wall bisynthesis [Tritonibacter multivorans]